MEKQEFVLVMNDLARSVRKYAPDFTDRENLAAWYTPLKDIPSDRLIEACNFAKSNLDEFPSIAWIIRKCKGTTRSDREIGQEISTRIEGAISKFGWTNPKGAREYMGPLAWEVVQQLGGWSVTTDTLNDHMAQMRKTWREIGEVVSKNFHESGFNYPTALPESSFSASQFIAKHGGGRGYLTLAKP